MPVISIPEPLFKWAEHQANRDGLSSPEEYVARLLQFDQQVKDPDFLLRNAMAEDNPSASSRQALEERRQDIERLLLAGMASGPAAPFSSENWDRLRRSVAARISATGSA